MKQYVATVFVCVTMVGAFLTSCTSPEPQPIDYGHAQCENCMMAVSDTRFGAEIVSRTGKTYVFDAPECMFGWYLAGETLKAEDIHSMWVTDHSAPATLIDVKGATFVHSEELRSPMSMNVASFAEVADAKAAIKKYEGREISYDDVLAMAEEYK